MNKNALDLLEAFAEFTKGRYGKLSDALFLRLNFASPYYMETRRNLDDIKAYMMKLEEAICEWEQVKKLMRNAYTDRLNFEIASILSDLPSMPSLRTRVSAMENSLTKNYAFLRITKNYNEDLSNNEFALLSKIPNALWEEYETYSKANLPKPKTLVDKFLNALKGSYNLSNWQDQIAYNAARDELAAILMRVLKADVKSAPQRSGPLEQVD